MKSCNHENIIKLKHERVQDRQQEMILKTNWSMENYNLEWFWNCHNDEQKYPSYI